LNRERLLTSLSPSCLVPKPALFDETIPNESGYHFTHWDVEQAPNRPERLMLIRKQVANRQFSFGARIKKAEVLRSFKFPFGPLKPLQRVTVFKVKDNQ